MFSFVNEREHLSLAGNLGFPVRDAQPGRRRGSAHAGWHVWCEGMRFLRNGAFAQCRTTRRSRSNSTVSQAAEITLGHENDPVRPKPGNSGRQVTTATPAMLDFRATEVADEGCTGAMSAESHCSIAQVTSSTQGCLVVCHLQASGIEIAFSRHHRFRTVQPYGNRMRSWPCLSNER